MGTVSKTRNLVYRYRSYKTAPGPAHDGIFLSSQYAVTDSRTGAEVPTRRYLIPRGLDATGTLNGTKYIIHADKANGILTFSTGNEYGHSGYLPGLNTPSNPTGMAIDANGSLTAEVEACASRNFFRSLRSRSTQVSGGVILGELAETIRMLKRPMGTLRKGVSNYLSQVKARKSRIVRTGGKSSDVKRMVSDTWLEYSFGWQPLLSDVKDIAIAAARLAGEHKSSRFRSGCSKERVASETPPFLVVKDRIYYDVSIRQVDKVTISYYGAWKTQVADADKARVSAARVAQLSGFTLSEFIPTAWELVPWSFLVDYFSNVGDMIQAYTSNTSEVSRVGKISIYEGKVITSFQFDYSQTKLNAGFLMTGASAASGTCLAIKRQVGRAPSSIPYPKLTFSVDLRLGQILNISALALGARPRQPFW